MKILAKEDLKIREGFFEDFEIKLNASDKRDDKGWLRPHFSIDVHLPKEFSNIFFGQDDICLEIDLEHLLNEMIMDANKGDFYLEDMEAFSKFLANFSRKVKKEVIPQKIPG